MAKLKQESNYVENAFRIICRGFKKNATTDADITDIIKAVYKRYINPKSSTKQNFRIDCIDTETKASIESKLKSLDKNIFDGAVNLVETHLATKFYPNFLTSDLFVEYVRVSSFRRKKLWDCSHVFIAPR